MWIRVLYIECDSLPNVCVTAAWMVQVWLWKYREVIKMSHFSVLQIAGWLAGPQSVTACILLPKHLHSAFYILKREGHVKIALLLIGVKVCTAASFIHPSCWEIIPKLTLYLTEFSENACCAFLFFESPCLVFSSKTKLLLLWFLVKILNSNRIMKDIIVYKNVCLKLIQKRTL